MKTKEKDQEGWLTSSRKAVDILRELQQTDIGTPVIPDEMRREMEEFMQKVETEDPIVGAPRGRV